MARPAVGAVDRLAPVLPIVIYTGPSRWTAALWVIDLVTPGASDGVAADVSSPGEPPVLRRRLPHG